MIKSKIIIWAGHVARRVRRGAYKVLVGEREGKRPLVRPRRRRENNMKMDLQEVVCGRGGMDWTHLAQDRVRWWALVNVVMNRQFP